MQDIKTRIQKVIVDKLGCGYEEVNEDANLVTDLGVDSLDNIELCMDLEKEFDISIPDDKWDKVATVSDIIQLINKYTLTRV